VLILIAGATVAFAQGAKSSAPIDAARELKPGQWIWVPEASPQGPVTILVDLSRQVALVYRNGIAIGMTTVSSGKKGHETPTGVFTILQKNAKHKSNIYNNAPMPYMQRLTWDGVALHAGNLPGYPQSHGCVRMPMAFAEKLFKTTTMGGTIVVAGKAGSIMEAPSIGVLAPMDTKGVPVEAPRLAENEDYLWTPEKSPKGPLTILISKPDARLLVLRNGVEIGRSRIDLPAQDFGTQVLTYALDSSGAGHWIAVGVPGSEDKAGKELDPQVLEQVRIPKAFEDAVRSQITAGTTIVVTRTPLQSPGKRLTIMDASK
jgi:hypothetical protein